MRIAECGEVHLRESPAILSIEEKRVARQAYAGLLWRKQFYRYIMQEWLEAIPRRTKPPTAMGGPE